MKITILSIPVLDQEKALQFYTTKLGFLKKLDKALDGGHRWITLVSPEVQDGIELLLEPAPLHFEPSKVYQDALFAAGIPWTQFDVDDVQAEYDRLVALGVEFSMEPKEMGTVKATVLNDTVGNYIQLVEYL
ncbi:MAG TPA: glyoxalase [Cytophagales bacterium]|nr:glyoxalase [Cytophagales bacterium]HAP58048.1 glyoxalase [Cytophagales bacterium]